ncbi:MAG: ferrous iron efflux protein F [Methanosaeta sp. PtaB.Bin018]|jgi:cation diffusion facilitator family transporter|nr:MAG: ferrous iron efflux protein F [Methanosaeta sp. PtaB.Bin018]
MRQKMESSAANINKRKSEVALLSVISNTALVILKITTGLMIGSVSVISEAVHSGVDLLAALIAFLAVKVAGKPADENHHFGHNKVENISGVVEALLIFLAAGWILFEAYKRLMDPEQIDSPGWGVAVMLISSGANIFVSQRLFCVGKETDSVALQADAWHLRTDIYTSSGVMAGLAIIWIGELLFPRADLHWVDPLVAIGVALLILKAAWRLTMESAKDLMDVSLPEDEEECIRKYITVFAPTVRGFHRLRTRKAGSSRFVEFHVRVDPTMSVDESHRISDMIADAIKLQYPGTTVTVHIEPCNCALAHEDTCGCLLSQDERKAVLKKASNLSSE